jgi:hypothetical protein
MVELDVILSVPPDGGYGWVIVFIAFIGYFLVNSVTTSMYLFRPHLVQLLHIPITEVATIMSTFYGSCMLLGLHFTLLS